MPHPVGMCQVCGKNREHHTPEWTAHIFSEDGKLVTWAEKARAERQRPPSPVGDLGPLSRLMEVLLERGLITAEDAGYVAFGHRTRTSPKMPEPEPQAPRC